MATSPYNPTYLQDTDNYIAVTTSHMYVYNDSLSYDTKYDRTTISLLVDAEDFSVVISGTDLNTSGTVSVSINSRDRYRLMGAGDAPDAAPDTARKATDILYTTSLQDSIIHSFITLITYLQGMGAVQFVGSPPAVGPNSITNIELADMPAYTLKGNNTGSTGDPIDLTVTQVKALLDYQTDEIVMTGDIITDMIADNNVTFEKIQQVTGPTLLGRESGSGDIQALTIAQVQSMLNSTVVTNEIIDDDGDTKVVVEESIDEDIVKAYARDILGLKVEHDEAWIGDVDNGSAVIKTFYDSDEIYMQVRNLDIFHASHDTTVYSVEIGDVVSNDKIEFTKTSSSTSIGITSDINTITGPTAYIKVDQVLELQTTDTLTLDSPVYEILNVPTGAGSVNALYLDGNEIKNGPVTMTILDDSITNAKLSDMPAYTLKGNDTGATGDPKDLTVAEVKTLLAYTTPEIVQAGDIVNYMVEDNTLTLNKLEEVTGPVLLGKVSGTGDVETLSPTDVLGMLNNTYIEDEDGDTGVYAELTTDVDKVVVKSVNAEVAEFEINTVKIGDYNAVNSGQHMEIGEDTFFYDEGSLLMALYAGSKTVRLGAYPNTRNDGATNSALYVDANGNIKYGPINAADSTLLIDADGDTKVEVEQSPDEDAIRITSLGQEIALFDRPSGARKRVQLGDYLSNGNDTVITVDDNSQTATLQSGSTLIRTVGGSDAIYMNVGTTGNMMTLSETLITLGTPYPSTRDDGDTTKALYLDASRNLQYGDIDFTTHTHALTSLSDVNISTLSDGDVLQWNGTEFINTSNAYSYLKDTDEDTYIDVEITPDEDRIHMYTEGIEVSRMWLNSGNPAIVLGDIGNVMNGNLLELYDSSGSFHANVSGLVTLGRSTTSRLEVNNAGVFTFYDGANVKMNYLGTDLILPDYPETRDDGNTSKALYVGSGGELKLGDVDVGAGTMIVSQTAHGFTLPVYGFIPATFDGTTWTAADTSNAENLQDAYITKIIDANTFEISYAGFINVTGHTLTAGNYYFLQDDGSIGLNTDPNINSLVVFVVDANNLLLIDNRPISLDEATTNTNETPDVLVTQVAHGFTLPAQGFIPLHFDGTTWSAANTTDTTKLQDAYLVGVVDADNFKIVTSGLIEVTHGLTLGQYYYLQDDGSIGLNPDGDIDSVVAFTVSTNYVHLIDNRPVSLETVDDTTGAQTIIITQTAHGFTVPTEGFIPVNNNAGTWEAADAATGAGLQDAYIVEVIDANNFVLQQNGYLAVTHGLTVGQYYYLQDGGGIGLNASPTFDSPVCHISSPSYLMLIDNRPVGVSTANTSPLANKSVFSATIVCDGSGGWSLSSSSEVDNINVSSVGVSSTAITLTHTDMSKISAVVANTNDHLPHLVTVEDDTNITTITLKPMYGGKISGYLEYDGTDWSYNNNAGSETVTINGSSTDHNIILDHTSDASLGGNSIPTINPDSNQYLKRFTQTKNSINITLYNLDGTNSPTLSSGDRILIERDIIGTSSNTRVIDPTTISDSAATITVLGIGII